jgi:hypothetical protein
MQMIVWQCRVFFARLILTLKFSKQVECEHENIEIYIYGSVLRLLLKYLKNKDDDMECKMLSLNQIL